MSNQNENNKDISAAIRMACRNNFGVLDSSFLCQSLGFLNLTEPVAVKDTDSLQSVIGVLRDKKIGCVLVLDDRGILKGIFTERDCVLKIFGNEIDLNTTPVSKFMTPDPLTATPDVTIAYALNLMSQGGFRHLPIVDDSNFAVSVVSIKDVIDHIVDSFTKDLLQFETSVV